MTLKRLVIELQQWGPDKDSYHVSIQVMEGANEISMKLPPEMGVALINQTKEAIHKFSLRAANQLYENLTIHTPPMLEAGEVKP